MALSHIGSAENSADNANSNLTVTLPGGIAQDDVVYLVQGIAGDGVDPNQTMTTAGYTELTEQFGNDDADAAMAVYRKVMGASPDSTAVCTGTGNSGNGFAAVCHVWRGANTATPEDATTQATTGINSSVPNSPSITTVTNDAVVLSLGVCTVEDTTVTVPSGYTNQVDRSTTTGGAKGVTVMMASIAKASAGAEDPGAWSTITTAITNSWAAASVAIRPAAGGQPTWKRWGGVKFMGGSRTSRGGNVWMKAA